MSNYQGDGVSIVTEKRGTTAKKEQMARTKRTRILQVRVSQAEERQLKADAKCRGYQNVSEYIRDQLMLDDIRLPILKI